MQDLFELNPHELPVTLRNVLTRYALSWDYSKSMCDMMLEDVNAIGYTFNYGDDFMPYDLRKKTKPGPVSSKTLPTNQTHHVRNHSETRKEKATNRRPQNSRTSKP